MLSHFPFKPFAVTRVSSAALGMVVRTSRLVVGQSGRIVVLLAVLTLSPIEMSAGIKRPLSPLDQEVIAPVGTHDQVLRSVVSSVVVDVVDFLSPLQKPTECALGHKDVLEYIPPTIRPRMLRALFQHVAMTLTKDAAVPVRVFLLGAGAPVSLPKAKELSLNVVATPPVPVSLGDRGREPTSTLTNTRGIQHGCAPNVCAVITHQSNIFGGYPLG